MQLISYFTFLKIVLSTQLEYSTKNTHKKFDYIFFVLHFLTYKSYYEGLCILFPRFFTDIMYTSIA